MIKKNKPKYRLTFSLIETGNPIFSWEIFKPVVTMDRKSITIEETKKVQSMIKGEKKDETIS